MMIFLIILGLPAIFICMEFIVFVTTGKRLNNYLITLLLEVIGMIIYPFLYLLTSD